MKAMPPASTITTPSPSEGNNSANSTTILAACHSAFQHITKGNPTMERILNRIALDHDLPVSVIRSEMEAAIHKAAANKTELFTTIFGDHEPTPEEFIAALAVMLDAADDAEMTYAD